MVAFKQGDSNDKRILCGVGTPRSIVKKRFGDNEPFTNFFSGPESKFNDKIDKEYKEFLLSEEIENILKE